ncbi:MAG: choice-of-anchor tandem repeat GloVer-containing protein [Rhodospirillales bacterium]
MTHQAGTALLACAACAGLAGPARATPTETTLYGAQCTPNASVLLASLIQPTPGSLIGTSFAGGLLNIGSVFRLMRNRIVSRLWPESVLYSFGSHTDPPPASDPASPMAGLLPGGVFYGTGYYSNDPGCGGNGCGAIYQLTPSPHSAAPWQEQVLYDFLGMPDGQNPVGNLVADASGALYGVTTNGGATGAGAVFA